MKRYKLCFRCHGHKEIEAFSASQLKSHSAWCKKCEKTPIGQIPKQ